MARFNEILVGRYNRFAQKIFSIKGPASIATLADEMMPVFPFSNGVENHYLESIERFASAGVQAGVAADFSAAQIRNPAGSNVVVTVEKIYFSGTAASDTPNVSIGVTGTDLTTQLTPGAFDTRGRTASTAIVSRQALTAVTLLATSIWTVAVTPANYTYEVILTDDQEIPILPGSALRVEQQVANQTLNFLFWWRERFLEESERT